MLGRTVLVESAFPSPGDGKTYSIVGVMPKASSFPIRRPNSGFRCREPRVERDLDSLA